jgi:hypothetical protein
MDLLRTRRELARILNRIDKRFTANTRQKSRVSSD